MLREEQTPAKRQRAQREADGDGAERGAGPARRTPRAPVDGDTGPAPQVVLLPSPPLPPKPWKVTQCAPPPRRRRQSC